MAEKRLRGLAAMSPERRSEIARMGGRAVHAQGRAPVLTPERAREIGAVGRREKAARRSRGQLPLVFSTPSAETETLRCEVCGLAVAVGVTRLRDGSVLEDIHACPHGRVCGRIGDRLDCPTCEARLAAGPPSGVVPAGTGAGRGA